MPEEHIGQLGFEYAWKELLARSRQSGRIFTVGSSTFLTLTIRRFHDM